VSSPRCAPDTSTWPVKPYPDDDEPRTLTITPQLAAVLEDRIEALHLQPDDLLFPSTDRDPRQPTSRNTFRTRVWRPAIAASGLPSWVRMHDLRHANASWTLAGGADLKTVMDRLGHSQISTTQQYLHTLPTADADALQAFLRIRDSGRPTEPAAEPPSKPEFDGPSL